FRWLQAHLEKGHPAQELLSHLLQKVDFDFTFPADIDLIEDAHALKESLLSEASSQDLMHTRSTDEFPASDNHH
ncbi:MAG: hypothetical protein RML93_09880, partial [Anaerolineales bacterium]|nr:hypothetical protein [Anaerolineales bacterium]MDW8447586.1 hypothetical protein [Anaerolineales bacterium]